MSATFLYKSIISAAVSVGFVFNSVPASASVVDISVSLILKEIKITGARTPGGTKLQNKSTSYEGTDPVTAAKSGDATDFNGDAKISVPNLSSDNAAKGKVTIGGETWSGLLVNGVINRGIQSDDEKKPKGGIKDFPVDFDGSYDSLLPELPRDGFSFNTFTLVNSGENGYQIDSLQIFSGLDLIYFTPANFATPAAISSGVLYDDVIADTGGPITISPEGQTISLSANLVADDTYTLLHGTVQEILGSGELGPLEAVNIAATAIPEPSTWAMMLLGFVGLGYAGFRKARARSTISIG